MNDALTLKIAWDPEEHERELQKWHDDAWKNLENPPEHLVPEHFWLAIGFMTDNQDFATRAFRAKHNLAIARIKGDKLSPDTVVGGVSELYAGFNERGPPSTTTDAVLSVLEPTTELLRTATAAMLIQQSTLARVAKELAGRQSAVFYDASASLVTIAQTLNS